MAMIMESKLYSARIESKVVKVPVPAINGKANGTTDAVAGISSLYIFIPKIISRAIKNKTKEPAMAKSSTFMPIISRILCPINKKTSIIASETQEALKESIFPAFCLRLIMTGIEPITSITANNTVVTFNISITSKTRFITNKNKPLNLKAQTQKKVK